MRAGVVSEPVKVEGTERSASHAGGESYETPAITPFGNVRDILRGANEGSIDDGVGNFKRGSEE